MPSVYQDRRVRSLQLFGAFGLAKKEEQKRMDKTLVECRKRIEAQLKALTAKRREVKPLERLKERRLETWEKETEKEIDQQAEEAYLAVWSGKE